MHTSTPVRHGAERRFELVRHSRSFNILLDTYQLRTKAVFDIGCTYGEFLIHFGKGSTGVTVSKEEADYGVARGMDIRVANVEDTHFSAAKHYDVIFANNIFEHLYSPHRFLIESKKWLTDDGRLILGVPCIPKIVSLLNAPRFRGSLAQEHINFFTKSTLVHTVLRGGWHIEAVRGFHFSYGPMDHLFDFAYPHFYVIAKKNLQFQYPERRLRELAGYSGSSNEQYGFVQSD
jgi:SAM-dependent methyltransferase